MRHPAEPDAQGHGLQWGLAVHTSYRWHPTSILHRSALGGESVGSHTQCLESLRVCFKRDLCIYLSMWSWCRKQNSMQKKLLKLCWRGLVGVFLEGLNMYDFPKTFKHNRNFSLAFDNIASTLSGLPDQWQPWTSLCLLSWLSGLVDGVFSMENFSLVIVRSQQSAIGREKGSVLTVSARRVCSAGSRHFTWNFTSSQIWWTSNKSFEHPGAKS